MRKTRKQIMEMAYINLKLNEWRRELSINLLEKIGILFLFPATKSSVSANLIGSVNWEQRNKCKPPPFDKIQTDNPEMC